MVSVYTSGVRCRELTPRGVVPGAEEHIDELDDDVEVSHQPCKVLPNVQC